MYTLTITRGNTRSWRAFLASALAICLAFGALGLASARALAAPSSSSAAAESAASSSSAANDPATMQLEEATPAQVEAALADEENVAFLLGKDAFLSGETLDGGNIDAPANLFGAGKDVTFKQGAIGADAFVAGETINLSGLKIGNNAFVAGNNITLAETELSTLFAAGNNLDISVDADNAYAAGRTIFLKGTFEGDVDVSAQTVVIDPYIVVKGTLNVTAEEEPTIASTAKVGSFNFNLESYDGGFMAPFDFGAIGSEEWLWSLLWMFLGMLLLGILMLVVLRTEQVDASGRLVKERPLAILVTGLVSLVLVPVAVCLLFVSGVGWKIALAFIFGAITITFFGGTYTAISLGRAVFGRINKWVSSILLIAIFALLMSIPVVDFILGALCTIYFMGSVIQGWWVWRRNKDLPPATGPQEPDFGAEFTVPRGSHTPAEQVPAPPASSAPLSPVAPVAPDAPLAPQTEYAPRTWNE